MNTYSYPFGARCPVNDELIFYTLRIQSEEQIMVEDIKAESATHTKGFHEDIARALHRRFGIVQLTAMHHGVVIETYLP